MTISQKTTTPVFLQRPLRTTLVNLYVLCVGLLGVIICVTSIWGPTPGSASGLLQDRGTDWIGILLFMLVAAIAELASVELFVSSRYSTVSVAGIIFAATIFMFGPQAVSLVCLVTGAIPVITTTLSPNEPAGGRAAIWRRFVFNSGMFVTAAYSAGWIFVRLGGVPGDLFYWSTPVLMLVASIFFFSLNTLLLTGILALQSQRRPVEIWQDNFLWSLPITILAGALGGGALAAAYQSLHLLGILVFCLPILSTSYSMRLYVAHTKKHLADLEELNRRLDHANLGLLQTLGAVIDAYDLYTYGHSTQVAIYTEALAEILKIEPELKKAVVRAALVHDIGKVGILDTITGKPGRLTAEEYGLMKQHPVIGVDILSKMEEFNSLLPIVRHHHEAWDGNGYPDGLKGEQIPPGARILAVADCVDAMASNRPYRDTTSFDKICQELRACSGTQFDPLVVAAFFKLVEERGSSFFVNSALVVENSIVPNQAGLLYPLSKYIKKSMIR